MVDVKEVADNIYMIDDQLYSMPKFGSVYLINEEKKALFDTGPTTSARVVLDGIRNLGISPEKIDYLIATHIHLDHAGGAGFLIEYMPKAQVIVHHRGAKHLVDPTRLVSSAIASQGQVKEATTKDGDVIPIEAKRVRAVSDGDIIELGKHQTLKILEAQGHAPHELCIYESRNNGLFTGDAAGISIDENRVLVMVNAPPSFDFDLSVDTLKRLMKLEASRIYYAHFGVTSEVQKKLQLAIDTLQAWDDIITEAVRRDEFGSVREKLMAHSYVRIEPIREKMPAIYEYLATHDMPMSVAGYLKCYQDKHGIEFKQRRNSESNQ